MTAQTVELEPDDSLSTAHVGEGNISSGAPKEALQASQFAPESPAPRPPGKVVAVKRYFEALEGNASSKCANCNKEDLPKWFRLYVNNIVYRWVQRWWSIALNDDFAFLCRICGEHAASYKVLPTASQIDKELSLPRSDKLREDLRQSTIW